jgi:hypothetical protein
VFKHTEGQSLCKAARKPRQTQIITRNLGSEGVEGGSAPWFEDTRRGPQVITDYCTLLYYFGDFIQRRNCCPFFFKKDYLNILRAGGASDYRPGKLHTQAGEGGGQESAQADRIHSRAEHRQAAAKLGRKSAQLASRVT